MLAYTQDLKNYYSSTPRTEGHKVKKQENLKPKLSVRVYKKSELLT